MGDRLPALVRPAGRDVVARPAHLVEPVEQARTRQRLEEVEDHLALAEAVEEHRRPAPERPAHVHAPGAEPETVRRDPLELRRQHPEVLGALRHLDLAELLRRAHVAELGGHRRDVVRLRGDGRVLDVGQRLPELLVAAVEVADHRVDGDDRLPLEGEDHPEDAVSGRVLRPHVHHEALVAPVAVLDDGPRGRGHRRRRAPGYRQGEKLVGTRIVASWDWRSGMSRPTAVCQVASAASAFRTSARWARSR